MRFEQINVHRFDEGLAGHREAEEIVAGSIASAAGELHRMSQFDPYA